MTHVNLLISVLLAVEDARAAFAWYERALAAKELWNLGSVVGMEIAGAPIFLGQPKNVSVRPTPSSA
jgi:hypothetical protein